MSKHVPVNVLYCESNMDGTIGGSHYCLLHLVENLDRTRFRPIVVFFEQHALIPAFQKVAETIIRTPYAPVRWSSGKATLTTWPLVLARRVVNLVKFVLAVAEHISFLKRHRIALVHQNNSITRHRVWMCAALLARVPCVASERGLNSSYNVWDRFYAATLALIIPMSRWIMDHLVERGVSPGNIRVMYDGVDPDAITITQSPEALRQAYGIRPEQVVVGIVGNIREWKGQETVVRALIEVVKVHPEVVCMFVGAATPGDKAYADRLHMMIEEAGIKRNVRFTGYQSNPANFVNIMRFVIHASVLPEPFGMVVLEAMVQRKAVIGSRAGGVIEMVVEGVTGYTFPPGDTAMLSIHMLELLGNPELAARMGEAGYERLIRLFTLRRYMEEIHASYDAILREQPVPKQIGIAPHGVAG